VVIVRDRVRLTAAGRVFLDKAIIALDAVRDARESVEAVQGLLRGKLSIGTMQSLPAFLALPSMLAAFHEDHPAIEVRLCQGSPSDLVDRVKGGRLDLAILPLSEPPPGVETTMIACEALMIACPPDHPLAGRSAVPLSTLKDQLFVDFEPDWGNAAVDRPGVHGRRGGTAYRIRGQRP
jgi:DNA-binding transcriptional LysR family regulator